MSNQGESSFFLSLLSFSFFFSLDGERTYHHMVFVINPDLPRAVAADLKSLGLSHSQRMGAVSHQALITTKKKLVKRFLSFKFSFPQNLFSFLLELQVSVWSVQSAFSGDFGRPTCGD